MADWRRPSSSSASPRPRHPRPTVSLLATTLAASPAPTCPPIREALPAFLAHQVEVGEIRASTASAYRNRLAVWAYPLIGDVPWDRVTREQIGAILLKIRAAKKSMAVLEASGVP